MQSSKTEAHVPSFVGPIEGYVTNQLKANYWKVQATLERDDVMQEARLVFWRCSQKYPGVDAPHFMALFKTAWSRRFCDLAAADTQYRSITPTVRQREDDADEEPSGRYVEPIGETDNSGALRLMVQQAPREVRMVLTLFLNAPTELLEMALGSWREDRRCKTNGSARICNMLGLPEDLDVMKMTHDYFRAQ